MTDMDWWQAALDELNTETLARVIPGIDGEPMDTAGKHLGRMQRMIDMAMAELASRPAPQPTVALCKEKAAKPPRSACDWRLDDKGDCPNAGNHII
jgi:hypothetical protein